MHPSLRLAGILPPLDLPHHLRKSDKSRFREGVIKSVASSDDATPQATVDIGFDEPIFVNLSGNLPPLGTRVTVDLKDEALPRIVSPSYPTQVSGVPWGYIVRTAPTLAEALSPPLTIRKEPYDLLIGLSERGAPINSLPHEFGPTNHKHALIVLGGLSGLELTIEKEKDAFGLKAEDAADLFDYWVNICPYQGSRTIRTEEALCIGLTALRDRLRGPSG